VAQGEFLASAEAERGSIDAVMDALVEARVRFVSDSPSRKNVEGPPMRTDGPSIKL